MTVVQAITLAGGFTSRADRNNSSVARLADGKEQRYKVPLVDIGLGRAENFKLQPGDILFVPEVSFKRLVASRGVGRSVCAFI